MKKKKLMKKRVKKSKQNVNKIANSDVLRNNTGRAWPMTPKAGVTLKQRRYNFGGIDVR